MSQATRNGVSRASASLTIDHPAPSFLGDPVKDALLEVCLQLASQLWVVRDRLAILERVISEHTALKNVSELIESYLPTDEQRAASQRQRDAFVSTILGPLARLDSVAP